MLVFVPGEREIATVGRALQGVDCRRAPAVRTSVARRAGPRPHPRAAAPNRRHHVGGRELVDGARRASRRRRRAGARTAHGSGARARRADHHPGVEGVRRSTCRPGRPRGAGSRLPLLVGRGARPPGRARAARDRHGRPGRVRADDRRVGRPGGGVWPCSTRHRPAALDAATALLHRLDATDADGRITDRGRRMAAVGAHPRLARAVLDGAELVGADRAREVVALLSDDSLAGRGDDLAARYRELARRRRRRPRRRAPVAAGGPPARAAAGRPVPRCPTTSPSAPSSALAYPDRIARARGRGHGQLPDDRRHRGAAGGILTACGVRRGWRSPWPTGSPAAPTPGCARRRRSTKRRPAPSPPTCSPRRTRSTGSTAPCVARRVQRLGAIELSSVAAASSRSAAGAGRRPRRAARAGPRRPDLDRRRARPARPARRSCTRCSATRGPTSATPRCSIAWTSGSTSAPCGAAPTCAASTCTPRCAGCCPGRPRPGWTSSRPNGCRCRPDRASASPTTAPSRRSWR